MDKTVKQAGVRKRASNACARCRQQKIKCSGTVPCGQCAKRNLYCNYADRAQHVRIPRGYIDDLRERLASFERSSESPNHVSAPVADDSIHPNPAELDDTNAFIDADDEMTVASPDDTRPEQGEAHMDAIDGSTRTTPDPALVNPLVMGTSTYVADTAGNPIYLGNSSNWSFGRRVLVLAHEKILQAPLPSDDLLFEGTVYDVDWTNDRYPSNSPRLENGNLPSADFAIYLINAVKFHCGQIFHLFDEESFMANHTKFHESSQNETSVSRTWFIHYLLILALGKAFVVRSSKDKVPPGAELFVQAMKSLPSIIFTYTDPLESMEAICCAALYLHSLDFRGSAYRLIGPALRIALEHGMHTSMRSQYVHEPFAERCRKVWWTVHILDRQMSALMGVPLAVRDEEVTAELPSYPTSSQKRTSLRLHVELSRAIAQIMTTLYGADKGPGKEFLINTKAALRNIAKTTDQLYSSFSITVAGSMTGISRVSAYLHLLHHQCVLLAVRPLLYKFLELRLDAQESLHSRVPRSGSVRTLLKMCVESAQHMLRILTSLQNQGLLETFLPFDLDSTFTSAVVLLLAAATDSSLLRDPYKWTQMAYAVLEEMVNRGNLIAGYLRSELQQLETILSQLPQTIQRSDTFSRSANKKSRHPRPGSSGTLNITGSSPLYDSQQPSESLSVQSFDWHDGFTTENLMTFADSLDLDGLDWLYASTTFTGENSVA